MANKEELQKIVILILAKSIRRKMGEGAVFETSDDEDAFFRELVRQTIEENLNPSLFYFEPISNKSFSVWYQSYYVGKIKLRGKNQFIQVLGVRGAINSFSISSSEDSLGYIFKWIKYIKYCLKSA